MPKLGCIRPASPSLVQRSQQEHTLDCRESTKVGPVSRRLAVPDGPAVTTWCSNWVASGNRGGMAGGAGVGAFGFPTRDGGVSASTCRSARAGATRRTGSARRTSLLLAALYSEANSTRTLSHAR